MDSALKILLILGASLLFAAMYYLLFKYVFRFTLFGDSISTIERLRILKKHNLIYRRHKNVGQKELNFVPFKKESFLVSWMIEATKYEFLNVVDAITQEEKYFWLIGKASVFRFPFNRVVLKLKEERDFKIIEIFRDNSPEKNILIENSCPACQFIVSKSDKQCPDCGLVFQ